MEGEKPLIVALGLGEMGLVHVKNLAKIRKIRLGIACTRAEVLRKTTQEFYPDRTYTSYDAAFEDPDVSAVVISTTVASHPDVISRAARAKKHIFCEKPLGLDVKQVRNCLKIVQENELRFMTGFQRRWDPCYVDARRRLDAGEIGDAILLKCTSGDPEYPEKYHREGVPHGMELDLGVHDIDLTRWLLKSEIKRVYALSEAMSYPSLAEMQDCDMCIGVLECENGAKAIVHWSRAFDYGYNVTSELVGTKGTVRMGDLGKTDTLLMKDRSCSEEIAWDFRERFREAFENEISAFADLVCASEEEAKTLVETNPSYASGADALTTTIVATALAKSTVSKMPEEVIYD